MLSVILPTMIQKVDYNAMNRGTTMSGEKTGGFSYDLSLEQIKKYCKAKRCTINDYASSVLSCALYAYFVDEEQRMTDAGEVAVPCPRSLHVAVPFSFRQPFKNIKDVKMHNDFGSILVDLKLFEKHSDALVYFKKLFSKLKTSFNPFGVLYATKLTVSLPFNLPKLLGDDLTRKFTMVYTNLNASK